MIKKSPLNLTLILAGILIAGPLAAAPALQKPRAEDYANFSQYLYALFDYRKAQSGGSSADANNPCKETDSKSGNTDPKKSAQQNNSCRDQALAGKPDNAQGANRAKGSNNPKDENLDSAIAQSAADRNLTNAGASSPQPQTNALNFPLQSVATDDLSNMGVDGLLGFLGGLMPGQAPQTTAPMRPDSPLVLAPGGSLHVNGDFYNEFVNSLQSEFIEMFGGTVILPDGQGFASAKVSISPDGGLDMSVNSSVHTSLYLVDRDGLPRTRYHLAGAMVVNNVGMEITGLNVHLNGIETGFNQPNSIFVRASSAAPIVVDLSGTRIGVASATPDAATTGTARTFSRAGIGEPIYFFGFGQNSKLSIGPGLSMSTVLSRPNGLLQPFLTLNGEVGDITLNDMELLEGSTPGNLGHSILRIKKIALSGIRMVNTKVYFDQQRMILDLGTGMRNIGFSLTGLSIGSDPNAPSMGQFSLSEMRINSGRISIASH